ncbi:V4R domain-containing protein [Marinibacterium sp. SX1]|uniref:V4R domain-containing protein n=1 Tax=Marinibacterium sp. SX1 TaxID=3388424 RepID=UPI003D1629E7
MSFRDRLTYSPDTGAFHDGEARYMMIKPEAFMGILPRLPAEIRPQVLQAMADTVFDNGGKSARTYRAAGAEAGDALLGVIAETAPQLGWGSWTFARHDDHIELTVANSPFAAGHGPSDTPVCFPILGMLRAVSGMVFGCETDVAETECAACGAALCRFTARPRG